MLSPGVQFEPEIRLLEVLPSITHAEVPFPSRNDPSDTAMAVPALIASAISFPSSIAMQDDTLHASDSGRADISDRNVWG